MFRMFSAGPKIVRPKGLYWNAVACKWSNITSSTWPSTCHQYIIPGHSQFHPPTWCQFRNSTNYKTRLSSTSPPSNIIARVLWVDRRGRRYTVGPRIDPWTKYHHVRMLDAGVRTLILRSLLQFMAAAYSLFLSPLFPNHCESLSQFQPLHKPEAGIGSP